MIHSQKQLHPSLHSSSKEMQLFWTHFFRWHWVTDPDPGSCTFCQMKPASLDYTLRKKKCNFLTFLRGEFLLFYRYSNVKSIAREPWTILEQVFGTLLPRALPKWNTLQSSSIYTLPKKKRNFPCCVSFEEECRFEFDLLEYKQNHWLQHVKRFPIIFSSHDVFMVWQI